MPLQLCRLITVMVCLVLAGCGSGGTTTKVASPASQPSSSLKPAILHAPASKKPSRWNLNVSHSDPLTTLQIEQLADQVFGPQTQTRSSGILILPVTDTSHAIRLDGLALSYQAMLALTSTGVQSENEVSPEAALRMLLEAHCHVPGTDLTDTLAEACATAVDASLILRTSLLKTNSGWELRLTGSRSDAASLTAQVHQISGGKLNTVPGLMAVAASDLLNRDLTSAKRSHLLTPTIGGDDDSAWLGQLLRPQADTMELAKRCERFVQANSRSLAGWRQLVQYSGRLSDTLERLSNQHLMVDDPGLQLVVLRRLLHTEQYFDIGPNLRTLSPSLTGDPDLPVTLLRSQLRTADIDWLQKGLATWRRNDHRYLAQLERARFAIELVEAMRQKQSTSRDDHQPTATQIREILEPARTELLAAVERHPSGWQAHLRLISLATELDRPRDEMEAHFRAVLGVVPGCQSAYRRKLQFLSPTRHGNIDDIVAFANDCLATERWADGIPQLALEALQVAMWNPIEASTNYATMRDERIWQMTSRYLDAVEADGLEADRQLARRCFAFWGTAGGHYEETAPLVRELVANRDWTYYDLVVFGSQVNLRWIADLHAMHSQDEHVRKLAAIRIALAKADFSQASELLAALPAMPEAGITRAYQQAAEAGSRLQIDGSLTLKSQDLMGLLIQFDGHSELPSSIADPQERSVSLDDDVIQWEERRAAPLYWSFPCGIRGGVISGEIELTGEFRHFDILLHTAALRDTVTVRWTPGQCQIRRGHRVLGTFATPRDRSPFRIELGTQVDVLEPVPHHKVETPVVDHVASGLSFAYQSYGMRRSGFKIHRLQIEQ